MTPENEPIFPQGGRLEAGLAAGHELRWAGVDLSLVVEEARRKLDLSPVATVAMGRCAVAAALLLRMSIKRPERLVLDVRGDGPLGRVLIEVEEGGALRGLIGNPRLDTESLAPGSELSLAPAIGEGLFRVRRVDQDGRSYESQVALTTSEIGGDLAHFLEQSEQRQSAVMLGVLLRPEGVAAAGGLIVEALPEASLETISAVEHNVSLVGSVSRLLEESGLEGALTTVLQGFDRRQLEERRLEYRCGCGREKLRSSLATLSGEDLAEVVGEDGTVDAECSYCGTVYRYQLSEIGDGTVWN